MSPRARNLLLLIAAVLVVAGVVWLIGGEQRRTVERAARQSAANQGMLAAMLEQESGLRGFLQTGRPAFLEPYGRGRVQFLRHARSLRGLDLGRARRARALLARAEAAADAWRADAHTAIAERTERDQVLVAGAIRRRDRMARFRRANAALGAELDRVRAARMHGAQRLSVALVLGLAAFFAGGGWLLFGRPAEREHRRRVRDLRRRERQSEFAHALQVLDSDADAHALVERHLERAIPGAAARVLDAGGEDDDPPSPAPHVTRSPLVASGRVVGTVVLAHAAPLSAEDRETLDATVTQAAPVLANMRNLALAERRALTDHLTGLANRRAVQDAGRRMVRQAARSGTSLAVLAIDIDHFKRINDRCGHAAGDEVLVAVARTLEQTLRGSDVVGRQGGEEFLVLLHDTGLDGALVAAENLRRAVAAIEVPTLDGRVTASFGVAVLPEDGEDEDTLLRLADRALYAAKARGRNRVEAAASVAGSPQIAG